MQSNYHNGLQTNKQTNIMKLTEDYTDCDKTPYVLHFSSMKLVKATKWITEERTEYALRMNYPAEFLGSYLLYELFTEP